jgi:hypothetical protein
MMNPFSALSIRIFTLLFYPYHFLIDKGNTF